LIIIWALCSRKGGNSKKSNLCLYAKNVPNAKICPDLILTHFLFFLEFPPFLLQSAHMLNEAHDRLLKVGQLIEEHYGQQLITSNIHLSLHITKCCHDYGPLYAF